LSNLYVATGHFRSGIYLSPATARVMSQLMSGETPDVDLESFRLDR
jgi:glycine/D-amino acid oxidase-like deaminating enzyme